MPTPSRLAPSHASAAEPEAAEPETPEPHRADSIRRTVLIVLAVLGLGWSTVIGVTVDGPTLWGLFPIGMYAVLAFGGLPIIAATVVSVASGLLMLLPTPAAAATLLGESVVNEVTLIGVIIVLGGALAEVLRDTGAAGQIVNSMMRLVGHRGQRAVLFGMMASCLLLVAALGTLAGALAVAVPLLLPVAAKVGLTRTATASTIFIGGCAGLALAPFAGSNVAIMTAADIDYLHYVLYGAGPLVLMSLVVGLVVAPWVQRRTAHRDDFYDADELGADEAPDEFPHSGRAAAAFGITLIASVVIAVVTSAGFVFPLIALPLLAVVTAVAGRMSARRFATSAVRGIRSLLGLLGLFFVLAVLFETITRIDPFTVLLDSYGSGITSLSPFLFAVVIALIGWVGVPGATAAQVVLLDQFFGEAAALAGVGAATWTVVLLFSSKADTYGPFPNPNMFSAMGLARSLNLKYMLITGWLLLVPSAAMYLLMMYLQTR